MLLLCLCVLWGCATTLSHEECRTIGWYEQGRADGVLGHAQSRLEGYRNACRDSGAMPDVLDYEQGRLDGVKQYCTPSGAYNAGRKGLEYEGVCTAPSDEFFAALHHGQEYYRTKRQIDRLGSAHYPFPINVFGHWGSSGRGGIGVSILLSDLSNLEDRLEYYSQWPPVAGRP
ncbi:MAG: DUF2799 domain-containing protein [Neomegalonema sp.]|nr:DUF2799 domain-containing protein [Neomegalonema sp.]